MMYTQQFKKPPPPDYGGTAIVKPKPACEEEIPVPPEIREHKRRIGSDELLILAVAFTVISGKADKNMLLILALIFILL